MQRNYNTTLGQPYTRVDRLEIDYPQSKATVRLYESTSVVIDGKVMRLEGGNNSFAVDLPITSETATQPIPMVDPATDEPTGEYTTLAQAIMVLTALSRHQQNLRDEREASDAAGAA